MKQCRFEVRISEQEKYEWESKAGLLNITVSELIRQQVNGLKISRRMGLKVTRDTSRR